MKEKVKQISGYHPKLGRVFSESQKCRLKEKTMCLKVAGPSVPLMSIDVGLGIKRESSSALQGGQMKPRNSRQMYGK